MLLRRLKTASPRFHPIRAPYIPSPRAQIRCLSQADIDDPNMNGGYINPPRQNRQHRDPHGDWWDKQERRNFGEPVHEDNDILGLLSLEEHRHFKPAQAFFMLGCSVATVLVLCGVVSFIYPDKPTVPRTFPGGLEKELGGPGTLSAPRDEN